ncbi:MAG: T9SS type A sorting domain-containing protein [Lewinellaceae bacterium]|nr:T9SS type A sorting domain-containing protein [Lewinellaceae bacterium]
MRFLSFLPMLLFAAFLPAQTNCNISGLTATVSDINPANCQYTVVLNFDHSGTTNQFKVQGNGTMYGTFTYNQLPLTLGPFTAGNTPTMREFVVRDVIAENCLDDIVVNIPACSTSAACNIYDVVVTTGDCMPNSNQYSLTLDFEVTAPTNSLFEVWAGNTQYLGVFPISALPVQINNFPGSGNDNDIIRICINDNQNCCEYKEFPAPDCNPTPCNIYDVVVTTGDCQPNSHNYSLTLDFEVTAPTNGSFEVWTYSNTYLGIFPISALPVQINNFPASGNANDAIKICINDNPNCCKYKEFPAPDCGLNPCEISQLVVETGDCNDATYQLTVNFDVVAPGIIDSFLVFANGNLFGKYGVNQLPLTIPNFPYNGGVNDVIKICIGNDQAECCRTKEFAVPDCMLPNPCQIIDLVVDPGECHNNGTYQLVVDFGLLSTSDIDSFMVFANGSFFGKYGVNQLPLTIPNFPWNGGATDMIKICVANDQTECCRTKEFAVPDCLAGPCEIFNLVVDPGMCTSNTSYQLLVNFQVQSNIDIDSFVVFANGVFFGKYGTNQLPLTIPNFPYNGGANDVIKVCVANTLAECCRIKEFPVPDCLGGPCTITDLAVDPGACTSNTSYQLVVNFGVVAPGIVDSFLVFANGNFFGKFGINQLPLTIPNFPYNGGVNDVIKICIGNNVTECCRIKEFAVPDCLNAENCEIYDLHVIHTPCLCGQFFAVVNFKFNNGGSGGFDIVGNGNNYGTFPYNHPQPIVLGPFQGNGTNYEFAVRDHFHPECHDAVELGEIVCTVPVTDPGNDIHLSLSPNPAGDWLQVAAQMPGGIQAGQSNIDVYSADGRLVIHQTVADGSNFQLNVSALPAGMYRLVVSSEVGRMEGTFAKR